MIKPVSKSGADSMAVTKNVRAFNYYEANETTDVRTVFRLTYEKNKSVFTKTQKSEKNFPFHSFFDVPIRWSMSPIMCNEVVSCHIRPKNLASISPKSDALGKFVSYRTRKACEHIPRE